MQPKKLKWLRNTVIVVIILALIGGVIYFTNQTKVKKEIAARQFQTVIRKDLSNYLTVSGNINAKKSAILRFAGGGKIVSAPVKESDYVKKGQTIAVIDQRLLQKQLDLSLNSYSIQRLDWDQQLDDIKDRTIDQKELRQVQKNQLLLDRSVLNVEVSYIQVTDAVMSAPFNGVITNSPIVSAGYNILPSEGYTLVDPESVVFTAFVDESDISKINLYQTAELTLDAYDELKIPSQVKFVAYQGTPKDNSQTFAVDFPLEDHDISKFRLGMNGNAEILLVNRQNVLVIDSAAISDKNGQKTVQVKKGDELETRNVTLGLETDEAVEVVAGLNEGEEVLIL